MHEQSIELPTENRSAEAAKLQISQKFPNVPIEFGDQLSPLQHQALMLLLAGKGHGRIASLLKVSRRTLWNWRNRNKLFRAAMREMTRARYAVAEARMSLNLDLAIGRISRALRGKDAAEQLRVSLSLVRCARHLVFSKPTLGMCNPDHVGDELAAEGLLPDESFDDSPEVELPRRVKKATQSPPVYRVPMLKSVTDSQLPNQAGLK